MKCLNSEPFQLSSLYSVMKSTPEPKVKFSLFSNLLNGNGYRPKSGFLPQVHVHTDAKVCQNHH